MKKHLLHLPTGVVGTVKKFYDGAKDVYISPSNGNRVPGLVVELEEGHSLTLKPGAFIELDDNERKYFDAAGAMMSMMMSEFMRAAVVASVDPNLAVSLVAAVVAAQARALAPKEASAA